MKFAHALAAIALVSPVAALMAPSIRSAKILGIPSNSEWGHFDLPELLTIEPAWSYTLGEDEWLRLKWSAPNGPLPGSANSSRDILVNGFQIAYTDGNYPAGINRNTGILLRPGDTLAVRTTSTNIPAAAFRIVYVREHIQAL